MTNYSDPLLLKSHFGVYFQIALPGQRTHSAGREKHLDDILSVERFVWRELGGDDVFWNRALRILGLHGWSSKHHAKVTESAIELIFKKRIRVYALPAIKQMFCVRSDEDDSNYSFSKGPDFVPNNTPPIKFKNEGDAAELIGTLNTKSHKKIWEDILIKNNLPKNNSDNSVQLVARYLFEKKLLVYLTPTQSKPPSSKNEALEVFDHGLVPLAPDTPAWIEVVLRDYKGAPIVDQPYVLRDSGGNEYKGVTSSAGNLRISNIVEGECELFFTEIDG